MPAPEKNKSLTKECNGKIFLVNASKMLEKSNPKNYIPDASIQRMTDTLGDWEEVEKFSRIMDHAEITKNDYNISHGHRLRTSYAETFRRIAEIVEKPNVIEADTAETDRAFREILKKVGC